MYEANLREIACSRSSVELPGVRVTEAKFTVNIWAVCARRSAKNYGCNFHCKKAKWRQNGGEMLSEFFLNYPHYFYFKSY